MKRLALLLLLLVTFAAPAAVLTGPVNTVFNAKDTSGSQLIDTTNSKTGFAQITIVGTSGTDGVVNIFTADTCSSNLFTLVSGPHTAITTLKRKRGPIGGCVMVTLTISTGTVTVTSFTP